MDATDMAGRWDPAVERALSVSRFLCVTVSTSAVVLLGVFFVVFTQEESQMGVGVSLGLQAVAWGIALAAMVFAPAVRGWLAVTTTAAPLRPLYPSPSESPEAAEAPGSPAREGAALMMASLAGFALGEIPLLVGFVLGVLTSRQFPMIQGAILSLILYALMWPRRPQWDAWLLRRAERAGRQVPVAHGLPDQATPGDLVTVAMSGEEARFEAEVGQGLDAPPPVGPINPS